MAKSSLIGQRRSAASQDSSASYQARRAEIMAAATRVFHRLGYKGASLSAVGSEMGVDRATIYYYFSSKNELFDEVIRAVLVENEILVMRLAESPLSPVRKMRDLIGAMMTSYGDNYPLLYLYIREDLAHVSDARSEWSADMRSINRRIEQSFVSIVEQGLADGSFRRCGSPRAIAFGILGMLNWTHRWYRPERGEDAVEIGQTFADLIISGLEWPYASNAPARPDALPSHDTDQDTA